MMRIGVISDTHMASLEPALARRLAQVFTGVDMILHAGDLTGLSVLDDLAAPQVMAVCGNMDGHVARQSLPEKRVIRVQGFSIGLIHGWGSPSGLAERVLSEFTGVDCVVFGHSHTPLNQMLGKVLMFNPGSVCGGRGASPSVGILTVDKEITGQILDL